MSAKESSLIFLFIAIISLNILFISSPFTNSRISDSTVIACILFSASVIAVLIVRVSLSDIFSSLAASFFKSFESLTCKACLSMGIRFLFISLTRLLRSMALFESLGASLMIRDRTSSADTCI